MSKVVLSGRPGYFVDDFELAEPFRGVGITGVRDRIVRISDKGTGTTPRHWSWYELDQLRTAQIRSFLFRRALGASKSQRESHVDRAVRVVDSTYNLSDLAKRPILLEMIGATLANADAGEVASPGELYRKYVDTWLQIDADKGAFRGLVSAADRLSFSIALAWILQDQGGSEIHWSELQELVGAYFRIDEADDVDYFSADVRTSTFLRRDDSGMLSFAHSSFQEYFCARFLVEGHKRLQGVLKEVLAYPEVTLAELAERSSATLDFVGDLLGCPVNPKFWRVVRTLMAEGRISLRKPAWKASAQTSSNTSLHRMLAMAEGDAEAFDLVDVADAYKDIYRFLRDRVAEEKAVRPREKWLRQVSVLLERGRLGPEELRKTSRSG